MSKYIDADRLKAKIERLAKSIDNAIGDFAEGRRLEQRIILSFITYLQQEQPKEICSKCIHHGKDDDCCYYPHGGMRSKINENGVYECTGFYEKEQEQPEVDLEKEYKSYIKSRKDDLSGNAVTVNMKDLARHFYELGKNSK